MGVLTTRRGGGGVEEGRERDDLLTGTLVGNASPK